MKKNYVLIDYENVQPDAIEVIDKECFKVIVFIGASQTKISFDVAFALQQMGDRAEYIKITGNGSNALDFHIAYYIGKLAAQEPDAYFHIVSRDTGFDPLIQHLKSRKILASRSQDVKKIPSVKTVASKLPDKKLSVIITNLKQRGFSKPRTVKTLLSTVNSIFQKQLSETELTFLLQELQNQGVVSVNENRVSYALPA